jgi:hypothetical protein
MTGKTAGTRVRRTRTDETIVADTKVVVSSKYMGKDESHPKTVEVRKFEVEPAYVRVAAGMTKNMGNYESLRVDVSITMPCYAEEVDKAIPKVADMVAAHLGEELKNYGEGD